jgi:hypothetical protein
MILARRIQGMQIYTNYKITHSKRFVYWCSRVLGVKTRHSCSLLRFTLFHPSLPRRQRYSFPASSPPRVLWKVNFLAALAKRMVNLCALVVSARRTFSLNPSNAQNVARSIASQKIVSVQSYKLQNSATWLCRCRRTPRSAPHADYLNHLQIHRLLCPRICQITTMTIPTPRRLLLGSRMEREGINNIEISVRKYAHPNIHVLFTCTNA